MLLTKLKIVTALPVVAKIREGKAKVVGRGVIG